jgi:hypothetical protein
MSPGKLPKAKESDAPSTDGSNHTNLSIGGTVWGNCYNFFTMVGLEIVWGTAIQVGLSTQQRLDYVMKRSVWDAYATVGCKLLRHL